MSEEITINTANIKKSFSKASKFIFQKKVLNLILIVLFLGLLIFSASVRTQNIDLLKDTTTGQYIPLALDPYYFLRIAETIVDNGGLPEIDNMRYPSAQVGFIREITPQATVFFYNLVSIFDKDVSLQLINIISPVIFFILGLILFFFLVLILTKSKSIAFLSSLFLAIIPTYLYRTLTGFSDHEAIGMFAFFSVLLAYTLSAKFLDKSRLKKSPFQKTIFAGLIVGFLSAFTIAAWGGISNFIFMIIPLSFILIWLIKVQDQEKIDLKHLKHYLGFYFVWVVSSILFPLIYGFDISQMINKVLLSASSILTGFVLLFMFVDYFMIKYRSSINFIKKKRLEKYRVLYSILFSLLIGIILLFVSGKGSGLISNFLNRLLNPFGGGRTSLTVAENQQPFLKDWISQTGKTFFWLFVGGLLALGINISRYIRKNKYKLGMILFWILMIAGILFSRISSGSLFNGTNLISQLFYFGSVILFFGYLIWLYFKDEVNVPYSHLILFSWAIFMIISAKGAIRLFFMVTPFVCFSSSYFIVNLFSYFKKNKDDFIRMITGILIIVSLIIGFVSVIGFANSTIEQSKYTGPSANIQWQSAMSWVRDNTPINSIFVHWWDYGYWVQYFGERPTVTDGGHAVGYWDHLIGRYLLTTPYPETALSFMKSHDVSYLLIDPTELGKYGAYSRIGSGASGEDRFSSIPIMLLDPTQMQETSLGEIRVYQGGVFVDEDIVYNLDGQQIFLPANSAAMIAIILETGNFEGSASITQAEGVFLYNNQQIRIPLRYIYFEGNLFDFEEGLNAAIRIMPAINSNGQSFSVDPFGSAIYLSPRTFPSLYAQLYLLDDVFNKYPTLKIAHSQPDPNLAIFNMQGANIKDIYFLSGTLRGPIKIWKVEYPSNVLEREEFLRRDGEYAEFDNLQFTK